MRITFILNQIGQCGGVINVLNIAKELAKRGHKVSVRYPYATGFHLGNILRTIGFLPQIKVNWMDTKGLDIKCVPSLKERYIPDGDAVIATWWETAYDVRDYPYKKGDLFYYVQHDESLWGGDKDEVELTYSFDLRIITNSRWTEKQLEKKGAEVEGIVYPGISDCYRFLSFDLHDTVIGAAYRDQHWKGWEDILKAFKLIELKYPDAKLAAFGHAIPNWSKISYFYQSPSNITLSWFYNMCRAFINASHYEGFGMTPLEAMRCKTPVCTTKVGVFQDFKDTGAFVSEPRDPAALAKNVLHVLENDVSKNVERAYEFAKQFTFEKAAAAMEGALLS